jgi:hypothetical protein
MLTYRQKSFIKEYIQTGRIRTACKIIKIIEYTYQKWRQNDEFMREIKKQEEILYNNSLNKMKVTLPEALTTLKELLDSDIPGIQLRAANVIINNTIKLIKIKEIRELLEILEEESKRQDNANKKIRRF